MSGHLLIRQSLRERTSQTLSDPLSSLLTLFLRVLISSEDLRESLSVSLLRLDPLRLFSLTLFFFCLRLLTSHTLIRLKGHSGVKKEGLRVCLSSILILVRGLRLLTSLLTWSQSLVNAAVRRLRSSLSILQHNEDLVSLLTFERTFDQVRDHERGQGPDLETLTEERQRPDRRLSKYRQSEDRQKSDRTLTGPRLYITPVTGSKAAVLRSSFFF